MSVALLALELVLLTAGALGLHAASRRYGLVPLLVYLAGLAAFLQGLGGTTLLVEPWPGVRFAATEATLVPVILVGLLVLYEAAGAAVARTAVAGLVGVSFLAFVLHAGRLALVRLAGQAEAAGAALLVAQDLRFVTASSVAFLVGVTTLVGAYQATRNHARFLPMGAVRTLALILAAAADTVTFRMLAFPAPVAVGGMALALAVKGAAVLLLAPAASWYLARFAPRLPGYVGPEERRVLGVFFGRYGSQQMALKEAEADRRRTEVRLRETDARFRHTFELAAVGIVHTTPEGTILMANPAAASFLGYQVGELEYRTLASFMHGDDHAEAPGGEPGPDLPAGERRFLRKNGTVAWGLTRTTEVQDEAGSPSYHIVVIEDITARRAAEARLRRMERLETLEGLTGGVAHDFNNLLAVITGDAEEAISRSAAGGDAAEALSSVLRAARKGAKLTQQLLAYAGQQVHQPEPLECGRLLHELSDLFELAVGRGIDVSVRAEPGLGVMADRTHLEGALLSLAANARDAMPRGGALTLRAFHEMAMAGVGQDSGMTQPTRHVVIEVADTGRGMTPEVAARAFDPFFTTKPVGEGSGLGLSMVYGFVIQSGGNVSIESEPGRGTTVRLSLPAAGDVPSAQGEPPPAPEARGRGETILVVEDDPEVGRVLAHALERLGYRVSVTTNAAEARSSVARARPSLVVADVMLPGGTSGADLAAEIGRSHPGLPVLFVSGFSPDFLQANCRLPADADVLLKPFESAELARRVRALLDRAKR